MTTQRRLELDGVPAELVKIRTSGSALPVGREPRYQGEGYVIARVTAAKVTQGRDGDGVEVRTITLAIDDAYYVDEGDDLDLADVYDAARNARARAQGIERLPGLDAALGFRDTLERERNRGRLAATPVLEQALADAAADDEEAD